MGIQPTASKTSLLLECARPFASETPIVREEPGEAARYGSALHEVLSIEKANVIDIAAKWSVPECADELKQHATRIMAALVKWLRGDNIFKRKFNVVAQERPQAMRILRGGKEKVRVVEFDSITHTYDLDKREIGGTADIVVLSATGEKIGVLDYKSGADWNDAFSTPTKVPQMLTLACMASADFVGIIHAPRGGNVVIYIDETPEQLRTEHAKRLRRAMHRIGDGSLRPGLWCKRCPAREGCPAKDGELLVRAAGLVKYAVSSDEMGRPVDKGSFHIFLQEFTRLAERARKVLREDVRNGEIISRPDGKVLVLKKKEYESLSKSSIIRALGKLEGEKMIEKLRKLGCISQEMREELWAVDE